MKHRTVILMAMLCACVAGTFVAQSWAATYTPLPSATKTPAAFPSVAAPATPRVLGGTLQPTPLLTKEELNSLLKSTYLKVDVPCDVALANYNKIYQDIKTKSALCEKSESYLKKIQELTATKNWIEQWLKSANDPELVASLTKVHEKVSEELMALMKSSSDEIDACNFSAELPSLLVLNWKLQKMRKIVCAVCHDKPPAVATPGGAALVGWEAYMCPVLSLSESLSQK